MKKVHAHPGRVARAHLATAIAVGLLAAPAVQAFEFSRGGMTGSLDTTVSYGYAWRVDDRDDDLIARSQFDPLMCSRNFTLTPPANPMVPCSSGFPGTPSQIAVPGRFSANRDDGNLKYDDGDAISSAIKITSELSMNWDTWGLFARATYFYDFENEGRDDMSDEAQDRIGQRFRMLDAFVFKDFAMGQEDQLTGTVRLGRQVVSWGESTFIQNGINVINPVDLSALRVAGAELKEAFLPIDMVWGSINLSENVSLEALYMFEFEEIEIDPAGTYFSSNDFGTPGGSYVMLGFGTTPQPVNNPDLYGAVCDTGNPLASDRFAELTAFYTANPGLIPTVTVAPGVTVPIFTPAQAAGAAIQVGCGSSVRRAPNAPVSDSGQFGFALRWYAEELNETEFGFYFMNYHSRLPLLSGYAVSQLLPSAAASIATGRYFVEYPEDIHLFGLSWNTTIPGGWAWQGEISHRPNAPLQVDDVELLFAALSPLNVGLQLQGVPPAAQFNSQLGTFLPGVQPNGFGAYVRGWREHEVSQLQMTFTKAFGNVLGAEQIALVGEIGATEVWDLPSHSELRYEGEGTDTGGGCDLASVLAGGLPAVFNPANLGCMRNPETLDGGFPTAFSWGYRLAARADYSSAFGTPLTLSPRIAFNHDVNGITPGPGGNFLEGRKSLTAGLEANYLNKWVFDLSYTSFFGAEEFNQIHDRDFASFTVKYSF